MLDPSQVRTLNNNLAGNDTNEEVCVNPMELSKQLHKALLKLKGQFLSADGMNVDYKGLRTNPDFQHFQNEANKLTAVDLTKLTETEQKAFFLNVYNTLTIHALALFVNDETTVLQLEKFWQKNAYQIGTFKFSLDDIEHGVLRCNKLHPTYKDFFFREDDPRRQFVQKELDPRIHFALNCGAKSCPPIRILSVENLDYGLDVAAKNFCQNDITINTDEKTVTTTKILQWYGGDFGEDDKSILQRILPFLSEDQASQLNRLLEETFSLCFHEYDWKIS